MGSLTPDTHQDRTLTRPTGKNRQGAITPMVLSVDAIYQGLVGQPQLVISFLLSLVVALTGSVLVASSPV
jgi:hypothetical protein